MTHTIDRCPGCNKPTHATESNDEGLCLPCTVAKYGSAIVCDEVVTAETLRGPK